MNKTKIALVTGITGQDGSFLAELLLEKGYEVHGLIRRSSTFNTSRIEHLYFNDWISDTRKSKRVNLHYGDLTDSMSVLSVLKKVMPDEVYNLAAQSHVKVSFEVPEYTADVDAIGTLRILEALRILNLEKKCKFYQASSSEIYGKVTEIPQSEDTPFYPRSPYGAAKIYGFWITKNYREAYNMFACNGILFNHESPRRGETFVTRKITMATAAIALGQQDCLYLGNLDAQRDWGHAKDYVEAMWRILQQDKPEDYVIAMGETTYVRDFVRMAFAEVGIMIEFKGEGVNEKGYVASCSNPNYQLEIGKQVIAVDPQYFRPTEVDLLIGDPTKSKTQLGWTPQYDLAGLVSEMVTSDVERVKREMMLKENGFRA